MNFGQTVAVTLMFGSLAGFVSHRYLDAPQCPAVPLYRLAKDFYGASPSMNNNRHIVMPACSLYAHNSNAHNSNAHSPDDTQDEITAVYILTEHMWTTSVMERDYLKATGWIDETPYGHEMMVVQK